MKIETLKKLIEAEIERNNDNESLLAEIMILIDLYEKDSKPSSRIAFPSFEEEINLAEIISKKD